MITERVTVSSSTSVVLTEGGTYTCPEYEGSGGAFEVLKGGTVTGVNVTFAGNVAFSANTGTSVKGGAFFNAGTIALNSATFTANHTDASKGQGGAIYNSGVAILTDTNFSGSTATMGGVVFNSGGVLAISGGTIVSSKAKYGGAVQTFGKGGSLTIANVMFSGNNAGEDGGVLANNAGTATISGATFSGNRAKKRGGAIWNSTVVAFTSAGVTFSGNTASTAGAIYNQGTINFSGTIDLATATDTWVNAGGSSNGKNTTATINWDLTNGLDQYGTIKNFERYGNVNTKLTDSAGEETGEEAFMVTQTITVTATQATGSYVIATGNFSDTTNKNTFTVKTAADATGAEVTIGGKSVSYGNLIYSLKVDDNGTPENLDDDKLILRAKSQCTVLKIVKSAGRGPVDDFLVYSRETCPLDAADRGSVFASAFFGGTVAVGGGLLVAPLAM